MRLVRRALVAVAAAVLVAAIILVGERGSRLSPDQQFAESVCATSNRYTDKLMDVHEGVVLTRATPGEEGWDWLILRAESGLYVAREFGRAVRQLDVPETPAGQQAQKVLDFYSLGPSETLSDSVERIRSIPPRKMTLVQNIGGLNRLQDDLLLASAKMGPGLFVTPNVVEGLEDEFGSAESCKKLAGG